MALTCMYAARGKNAGPAVAGCPETIADHRSDMRRTKEGSVAEGSRDVWGSVPGSTVVGGAVVAGSVTAGVVVGAATGRPREDAQAPTMPAVTMPATNASTAEGAVPRRPAGL